MAPQQKFRVPLPPGLSDEDREALADAIIEYIVDRTQKGKDKDGSRFPKYSKSYTKSMDFEIAGKSPRKVDLQLSGDMLAALQLLDATSRSLWIGYEKGDEINDRVEGNRLGSYGGDPDPKKARDFLGIEPDKLAKLIAEFTDG